MATKIIIELFYFSWYLIKSFCVGIGGTIKCFKIVIHKQGKSLSITLLDLGI